MLVIGIETSCDETAASVVDSGRSLVSNLVASQIDLHREYGGVVPEIAARAHVDMIVPVISSALRENPTPELVAVTAGPGLVGSLAVGVAAAKGLSWSWGIPLVAVNHLEAHIFAPVLEGMDMGREFLALVVSGGHTLLARASGVGDIDIIGETRDDAIGEAYDKVSKFLGLGYPGGPVIDRLAKEGDPEALCFPRPMKRSGDYNFSFSGLKTAVVRYVEGIEREGKHVSPEDLAASFQAAALEVVVEKTVAAAMEYGLGTVVMGGGVACNSELRRSMLEACGRSGLEMVCPGPSLCTDNAAMVAALGYYRYERGMVSGLDLDVYPNLKLGSEIQGALG